LQVVPAAQTCALPPPGIAFGSPVCACAI
jgi:hypothetical protein